MKRNNVFLVSILAIVSLLAIAFAARGIFFSGKDHNLPQGNDAVESFAALEQYNANVEKYKAGSLSSEDLLDLWEIVEDAIDDGTLPFDRWPSPGEELLLNNIPNLDIDPEKKRNFLEYVGREYPNYKSMR